MFREEYARRDYRYYAFHSYAQWLEVKLRDVRECARRADEATRAHRSQLFHDFGIIYDAPMDMYLQTRKPSDD